MNFWKRFWYLLFSLGLGLVALLVLQLLLAFLLMPSHQVAFLHSVQYGQNIFIMVGGSCFWAWFVYVRGQVHERSAFRTVCDELQFRSADIRFLALTLFLMISAIPLFDALEVLNVRLPLPESLREYALSESARNMQVLELLLQPSGLLGWVELITLMCFTTAVGEEFLFRGAMLNCFLRNTKLNLHLVACLVGLIFALIHFEMLGLIPRWLLGALFVYLVYWSKSLWPAILAHALNNLFALISYKTATPEELLQIENRELSFSPLIICLSAVVTVGLLWQMFRMSRPKPCC